MKTTLYVLALAGLLSGCTKPAEEATPPTVKFELKPQTTYQTITGFGGANRMWGTQTLQASDAAKAFETGDGQLGLSLFRVRLSSNKNDWPLIVESIKEANKRNVKVLACPWSPPPALKSNNSDVGGRLLPENYKAFKDYINEYVAYMASKGAKIDAVSIQNEPDWSPSYESCDWTAAEMIAFLKAPGQITGVKVVAPESLNFNAQMTNALLSDADAAARFDIVAGHTYGAGGTATFPTAIQQKKEIWMTEYLLNLNTGNTGAVPWASRSAHDKWLESLDMLTGVHNGMSSNWNAYIWWYLQRYYSFIGDGEQGTTNGEVQKRGYAFSHFSRFVRPGAVRIDVAATANYFLKVTAYKSGNQTIVQVINTNNYPVKNVQFSGLSASSATTYTTTETATLEKQTLTVSGNALTLDFPVESVTTLVIN